MQFKQTMTFFQPLFKQLKRKALLPEMVAGLDMIVEDIKQRNYLHAYDIYMRLAIGDDTFQSAPLSSLSQRLARIACCGQPHSRCLLRIFCTSMHGVRNHFDNCRLVC